MGCCLRRQDGELEVAGASWRPRRHLGYYCWSKDLQNVIDRLVDSTDVGRNFLQYQLQ